MSLTPLHIVVSHPDAVLLAQLHDIGGESGREVRAIGVEAEHVIDHCRKDHVNLLIGDRQLFESEDFAAIAQVCHALSIPIMGLVYQLSPVVVEKATQHGVGVLLAQPISPEKLSVSITLIMKRQAEIEAQREEIAHRRILAKTTSGVSACSFYSDR